MSNQSTTSRLINSTAARNIIAKRKIFRTSDVNELLKFEIQGKGNTIAVTKQDKSVVLDAQGNPLMKTIYNTKVNSHVAMLNPRNQEILKGAMQFESDGDDEAAHRAFNDYLNKIQVSFSVIINPGQKTTVFSNGDLVKGRVTLVTTENGQLLTVENVTAVRIEEAANTQVFTLEDLIGITGAAPDPSAVFTPLLDGADKATDGTLVP